MELEVIKKRGREARTTFPSGKGDFVSLQSIPDVAGGKLRLEESLERGARFTPDQVQMNIQTAADSLNVVVRYTSPPPPNAPL